MENNKTEKLKSFVRDWGPWAIKTGAGLLCLYIIFGVIFAVGTCRGDSMNDTLHDGDLLFFQRVGYEPQFGDIVCVEAPNTTEKKLIKRIIGMPGDTLYFHTDTGEVYRNGELLEEPYLGSQTYIAGGIVGPVTVEEGHYFVMGDNRMHSLDSRYTSVGQIPRDHIFGHLLRKEDWNK